ncbi:MAG: recombinase family protein [Patulibacter sp.]
MTSEVRLMASSGKSPVVSGQEARRRAVLYVRISDDPEGVERGVARQETDCRDFAEAQGLEVVEVVCENDTSAFKQRTVTLPSGERVRRVVRPGFRTMLRLLAEGRAEITSLSFKLALGSERTGHEIGHNHDVALRRHGPAPLLDRSGKGTAA